MIDWAATTYEQFQKELSIFLDVAVNVNPSDKPLQLKQVIYSNFNRFKEIVDLLELKDNPDLKEQRSILEASADVKIKQVAGMLFIN